MDIGSIFLILALFILVGLFVGRPLIEKKEILTERPESQADHERSTLLAERDRILNALQELDFDHGLGKIPEEDYPSFRTSLLQRGADVLRKLDVLESRVIRPEVGLPQAFDDDEARLEAAIAARRAEIGKSAPAEPQPVSHNGRKQNSVLITVDDDLELMLANRRRVRQGKASGFCPKCGSPVQKTDRFCPKCGAKIA